ncbi:hypothetical protein GDO81_024844 [Engystomops pustulosus]|uniref:Uncharacterized protein n=1 Tax=Engystomops pustulosus TaxID=76066 RepID=A0AAV6YQW1_ENGPU|nr:hypothetical protein GDO81_024844 [Engystomops pustulosus]
MHPPLAFRQHYYPVIGAHLLRVRSRESVGFFPNISSLRCISRDCGARDRFLAQSRRLSRNKSGAWPPDNPKDSEKPQNLKSHLCRKIKHSLTPEKSR